MMFKKRLIPYTVPQIELKVLSAMAKDLFTGKIYDGPDLISFERDFAKYIGTKYAICFTSGRYALFLTYKFFCENKSIILPAYTCIPAIDAARWAGAKPFFVDIDLNSYNPVFNESLTRLENVGAISLSYLYGLIGDLDPFLEFGKDKGIPIVEDAAIAIGGLYKGKKVGTLGDAAIFSLQSSKILTAWKGSVITTNNYELYEFLLNEREKQPMISLSKLFSNLSITYLRKLFSSPAIYGFTMYPLKRFAFSSAGKGFVEAIINQNPKEAITGDSSEDLPLTEKVRFINLQASVVIPSFRKIESLIEKRRYLAKLIFNELKNDDRIKIPEENTKVKHAFGRYPIRIPGLSKFALEKLFLKQGIEIALNYPYIIPNTPFMKGLHFNEKDYPNALIASRETFLLPFHTFLKEDDIFLITNAIKKIDRSDL